MNIEFLREAFGRIPQHTVSTAVSNINAYRNFIGNGVAVGKLAEVIIAKMFTNPARGIHGFSFAFTGKNPPFDIMVYERSSAIPKERFTEIRGLFQSDFDQFCRGISRAVGSDRWCGVSLKNYLNEESQVTTNYGIRTKCEEILGTDFAVYRDAPIVQAVLDVAQAELSQETILLLNSFPGTMEYQFRLFSLPQLAITQIEFMKKAKHTRYVFGNDRGAIFHIKYGKNQANPFQRGIWIDDLAKLPLLQRGTFSASAFGKYILDGALILHELTGHEDEQVMLVREDGAGQLPLA